MNTFTLISGEEVSVDENNMIETQVIVSLDEVIDTDGEGFLDLISDRVTGTCLLSDIAYSVAGNTPEGDIIIKVEGDITHILEDI